MRAYRGELEALPSLDSSNQVIFAHTYLQNFILVHASVYVRLVGEDEQARARETL